MSELISMLSSPVFWVGTVVVGIVINFASQYLYPRLGALPDRAGAWWRDRSQKRKADFDAEANYVYKHQEVLLPLYYARASRQRWVALMALHFAVLMLVARFGVPREVLIVDGFVKVSARGFISANAMLMIFFGMQATLRQNNLRAITEVVVRRIVTEGASGPAKVGP